MQYCCIEVKNEAKTSGNKGKGRLHHSVITAAKLSLFIFIYLFIFGSSTDAAVNWCTLWNGKKPAESEQLPRLNIKLIDGGFMYCTTVTLRVLIVFGKQKSSCWHQILFDSYISCLEGNYTQKVYYLICRKSFLAFWCGGLGSCIIMLTCILGKIR